ncbi:MAG TPA: hypothetical protein VG735_16505 [Caulobacterales bacterium]|nr:hypothetical protein [Caulobacterales bacterium]
MNKFVPALRAGLLLACLSVLSACVSITAAKGTVPLAAGGYSIALEQTWSDVTALYGAQTPKARVLTLDGVLLDRLYLIGGVGPGASIVRSPLKERPSPVMRADLSLTEQVEFLTDSISALGYKRVESTGVRPQTFGGADGVRVDYRAQTAEGLEIGGTALLAVRAGKLNAMVFLAPQEYYYPQNIEKIEAVFRSATFGK